MNSDIDPSPFPGMDPFLEDSAEWPGLHARLIVALSDQLTEAVAPDFVVAIEQRLYILAPDDRRQIVPDVYLVRETETQAYTPPTIASPTLVEPIYETEIRDRYIEIRDRRNREVITTLELLSPFNKAPGHQGYGAFQQKRRQVMASPTNWLEIDLLRAGERPPEVTGKSDYYALLKRGNQPGPYEVWYFDLRDPLPTIAVPLLSPVPDVALELQAVFTAVYRRAHYGDSLDYSQPVPPPPLRPADLAWVNGRIAQVRQAD
jgi:hypothetical protein